MMAGKRCRVLANTITANRFLGTSKKIKKKRSSRRSRNKKGNYKPARRKVRGCR
jgi:hypothetical protein